MRRQPYKHVVLDKIIEHKKKHKSFYEILEEELVRQQKIADANQAASSNIKEHIVELDI